MPFFQTRPTLPSLQQLGVGLGYFILLPLLAACSPDTALPKQPSPRLPAFYAGDLGGMAVRIPAHCIELVEYDGDPRVGEARSTPAPPRDFHSRLRSFGLTSHFPEMTCPPLKAPPQRSGKAPGKPDPNQVYIGINAGEIYPRAGALAADRNAQVVINSLQHPGPYWFANYERLPGQTFGLDAYVVTGQDPKTGQPARDSLDTDEVFIHLQPTGQADTFISCNKGRPPAGQAHCQMRTGMEPAAEVRLNISFPQSLLPHWQDIRQGATALISSFKAEHSSTARRIDHDTNRPNNTRAASLRSPS